MEVILENIRLERSVREGEDSLEVNVGLLAVGREAVDEAGLLEQSREQMF